MLCLTIPTNLALLAGIYVHIPFCKQACHYCDFHFSTNLTFVQEMVDAICLELKLQKNYLNDKIVSTIYFGGGTPSLLSSKQLSAILSKIYDHYSVDKKAEITLEANPDDLNYQKLADLRTIGFNRLSIGIQSFHDHSLKQMNRTHSGMESLIAIENAVKAGFQNISIDLIYGMPNGTISSWKEDISRAVDLNVSHISAYCLTIESGTVFGHRLKNNQLVPPSEDLIIDQFDYLIDTLESANYQHYEISNFCQPDKHSKHNSNYWRFQPYLGVGPSAHSFNLNSRRHGIKNNSRYVKSIKAQESIYEEELLTPKNLANECLLTSIRTIWGCDLKFIKEKFNIDFLKQHDLLIRSYVHQNLLTVDNGILKLTKSGKFLADKITEDLYII